MGAPDRYRQARRWLGVGVALQLLAAVPLLVTTHDGDERPTAELRVATAPVLETPATTTTLPAEVLGVVHEATTTTALPTATVPPPPPSPTTTTVAAGAVHGIVWAGEGGTGRARLEGPGTTREQVADAHGRYRFDGVAPGRYVLDLGAESASAPCTGEVCIGTAVAVERHEFDVAPGEQVRRDFGMWPDTPPPPAPQ